ncbi:hypothetical protein, partial [Niveispirillum irakense]|uniref:hypothetical protein n=1 Tax=Niveispirillum irakense TaxID=34011 RepID=UPI0005526834
IRRRLVTREPENTQFQRDLAVSLVNLASIGDQPRERFTEALTILTRLQAKGLLTKDQEGGIDLIKADLAQLPPASAGTKQP